MASISSLSSSSTSSTSSLFANSNVISGLASGMDTESMIENAVSGIKEKISGLNKDRTRLEWEQSAYQSIIDKLASFAEKYTPYYSYSSSSSTNLLTEAFFNNATKISTSGTYANMISATGTTSSTIQILSATQATKATLSGARIELGTDVYAKSSTKASDISGITWANKTNDAGNKLNSAGKIVDDNGYLADADGYLVDASGNYIVNENNQKITSANLTDGATYKIGTFDENNTFTALDGKDSLTYHAASGDTKAKWTRMTGEGDDQKEETVLEQSAIAQVATLGFTVNGQSKDVEITSDMTMSQIASKISSVTGLEASFSESTGAFLIKSQNVGKSEFSVSGDAATALFGSTLKAEGTDAKVTLNVNGHEITQKPSGNQIEVDGMTINIKGDFTTKAGESAVSLTSSMDSDKIVNVIKSMVEEFNAMANEVKDAYSTQPLKNSNNERYEPLSEEEAADMSESAIEKYEKKAKTGLLFADSDLSALYDELRNAANALGSAGIGLTAEYKDGKTTLVLDEDKLRSTLEADPDKVKDAFTKEKDSTDTYNSKGWGGMTTLKNTLHKYANTSGALTSQGILVQLAGTEKSTLATAQNTYKSKLADMDELIARWQEKLSTKIDYYQTQFTNLEKMISQMNSQSSSLSGMMGY